MTENTQPVERGLLLNVIQNARVVQARHRAMDFNAGTTRQPAQERANRDRRLAVPALPARKTF
ncbi:MAG TPA: hypothetical protein VN670_10620 [Acidobacteriaceae bacterium]|nr:hypothetical protein [Acidobacteriaceae bacterium]